MSAFADGMHVLVVLLYRLAGLVLVVLVSKLVLPCAGDWSEEEAFFAALETWPKDVRPAVHWSESQEDRKPHAHSDYIQGPMNLHGKEADVDVMIEAKCKERTLLRFRDATMGKADPAAELPTSVL